ncbi:MAG: hypothetical protein WDZ34_02690 [Candidatus Saccharimonadales bacterium]
MGKISRAEYYYDIGSGVLLLGKVALGAHIEAGGNPADIENLGDLLRNGVSNLPTKSRGLDAASWERDDFISYGRWLVSVTAPPPNRKSKAINEKTLTRARDLGIGPNPYRLIKTAGFKNTNNYYRTLNIDTAHFRRGPDFFNDWDDQDYLDYIRRIGSRLGRRPTRDDLRNESLRNSLSPSEYQISTRFGNYGNALEAAGYVVIANWGEKDYIDWGVKFMKANQGYQPSQKAIDFFSQRGLGPSSSSVRMHFKQLTNFQGLVKTAYEQRATAWQERNLQLGKEIQEWLDEFRLPVEVLSGSKTPFEIIRRFAHYKLLDVLLPEGLYTARVEFSAERLPLTELVEALQTHKPGLTIEKLKETAESLGVDEYIGGSEYDLIEILRLPDEFMSTRRVTWKKNQVLLGAVPITSSNKF